VGGERRDVDARRTLTKRILSRGGGLSLGTGRALWEHGRYDGPYLR
jgi:hypothetical protein